ncbi:hypothetical protein BH10BAC5_BH10BAC5_21760 [soil metagenome]
MTRSDPVHKEIELNSLIEFSQLLNSNLDLQFVLRNILLSIMGKMLISKGLVLIKKDFNSTENEFTPESFRGILKEKLPESVKLNAPKDAFFNIADIQSGKEFFNELGLVYFFKIYFNGKLLGILCIGKKLNAEPEITKSEIIFIETVLNISASSIENTIKFNEITGLNKSLDNKITQLKALFELSKEFNSNFLNKEKILNLLSYTLLGNLGVKDFIILSKNTAAKYVLLRDNRMIDIGSYDTSFFSSLKAPLFIKDHASNDCLRYLEEKGFELIIPTLNNKGEVDNIIVLGKKLNRSEYKPEDIEFLESIVNLSVISLENSTLFDEFLEKKKIESELQIAREIQIALLPKFIPKISCYDVVAENIPALQVGGDYFDIIKLSEDKYALAIADVSGKGTPASLLMSNIQSSVHSYLKLYREETFDLSLITEKINEVIYENTSAEKFITFFWGLLDCKEHTFEYINAGHNPPVIIRKEEVINLDKGGFMIGILDTGVTYEKGKVDLKDDDIIIFYTDGVTEAMNTLHEEFGEEKLIGVIREHKNKDTSDILSKVKDSIAEFTMGMPPYDDITMIILKKNTK